jgi:alginate O-acetyltransferase complex protein AlgI
MHGADGFEMLFNSYIFLFVFLPAAWVVFRLAGRLRVGAAPMITLVAASLIFYAYWDVRFVLLIVLSAAFNYCWALLLDRPRLHSRFWLALGIGVNLAVLGYFKYTNFLLENLSRTGLLTGMKWDIILPLGISFFTFVQVAYLVDRYRGAARPGGPLEYATFATFFPQLIAGPIVRQQEIVPCYRGLRLCAMSYRNLGIGLGLIALGLFKKVIIADTLSPWVDDAFDTTDKLTFLEAWAAALTYALQIYFDFSAYSDLAIGVAKLFNVDLPINFRSPYKATSEIDFWRRWHVSLSRFLRDYLYIPLGGNRRGVGRQYANLLATMLLAGLWHGAAWTFVLWGGLHGAYLSVNHMIRRLSKRLAVQVPPWLGWAATFTCVNVAWVFFRAQSVGRAVDIVRGMAGLNGVVLKSRHVPDAVARVLAFLHVPIIPDTATWHWAGPHQFNMVLAATVIALALPNAWDWAHQSIGRRPTRLTAVFIGITMCISVLFLGKVSQFVYFQF